MSLCNTSLPLLNQLKHDQDQNAWNQFYEIYSHAIIAFCRKRGCSESLSYDVLQETMVQIWKYISGFRYDPRKGKFRSYLFQIVQSRIRVLTKKSLPESSLDALEKGGAAQIGISDSESPWAEFDRIWKDKITLKAFERVEKKVDSLTWKSFIQYGIEGRGADEVAEKFKISKNTVYQHKIRVMKLLAREVQLLESELEMV